MKKSLLKSLQTRFKRTSKAIRQKLSDVNENASLYELITCVNTVKDLSEFDALLDSKLASQK